MIIYGASGHGKVILDCCKASGIIVSGFRDKDPDKLGEFMGYPVWLEEDLSEDNEFVLGIGNNQIRKLYASKLEAYPSVRQPQGSKLVRPSGRLRALIIKHPSAIIAKSVTIGPGTVVFHNSVIQTGTSIGQHCIINTSASVDHDCKLEDFVHIAPNATLCGGISVGEGTLIGAGATVIPNIKIGKWAVIGAGSVVTKDIPDYGTAAGNPARIIKINTPT